MHTRTAEQDRTAQLSLRQDGCPQALVWQQRQYVVTDAPTRLEDALDMLLTHPLPVVGWRFQGTAVDGGEVLVFDVLRFGRSWSVVRTYC
ncbi:hypothetical protein [uncultured Amnibacterium sp.]|uniref:hypothetical protein n=1 Tax=uncultured Amnibacterium sp. TaxID=1631851 RepID=UPI0035CA658D